MLHNVMRKMASVPFPFNSPGSAKETGRARGKGMAKGKLGKPHVFNALDMKMSMKRATSDGVHFEFIV